MKKGKNMTLLREDVFGEQDENFILMVLITMK